jgi:RpiB/LacA/LacB family sugar-phosphate isomerase
MKSPNQSQKIVVGSDHVALTLKNAVIEYLESQNIIVIDVGPYKDKKAVDYPDYAQLVAQKVLSGEGDSGIAICGTGIGMSIAANKVKGIRAGLCHDPYTAHQARAHNNANILCMGAWIVSPQRVGGILEEWITTDYEDGRHQQRLFKIENPAFDNLGRNLHKSDFSQIKFSVALSPNLSVFGPLLFAGKLDEGLREASENGFDAVELSLRDPTHIPYNKLQKLLTKYHLGLSAIATGQSCLHDSFCLSSTDEAGVNGALVRLEKHIELAARFNAAVIIGGIRGNLSNIENEKTIQRERALEAFHDCSEKAQYEGVQLLIEPINRYETNFINTAEDAIHFIEEAGHPEIKLLLDSFHMNIEEEDIHRTINRFSKRIGYIHFADSNRKAPGWGHLPLREIMETLMDVNYTGVIGAEILPLPDDYSAIQQAGAFFRSLVPTIEKFE